MSGLYDLIKTVHILSATVLFGTGLGTAFQMWFAHLTGDPRTIATVARNVVRADFWFTTPAVILQPASGIALIHLSGLDARASWLMVAYGLYLLIGLCWLPVVWLQIRVRDLAVVAVEDGTPLPPDYHRVMRLWFGLGWPAFLGTLAIFWLMVAKPALQ
ncbi:MAG: putative integral rane protein [Rhodospirillales bacterium]|nr:putative integral rane protein [Rhodospirillales bacterium]